MKAEWQALYDLIPTMDCKRKCQACCGPIGMTAAEYRNIGTRPPFALFTGKDVYLKPKGTMMRCPLLVKGICSHYENRPMICRLWGTTEAMRCPYGCVPSRWLSHDECQALLLEAELLSESEDAVTID